ncbi:unnamed protein product [Lymnaea stagnalis]|uniref:G-protein coupled receptors family 1 profile domain-containing protein n=1 Tax=Lymnaea stagnalis TaxID=6523 RepID=A0AAV2IMF0_LYMST
MSSYFSNDTDILIIDATFTADFIFGTIWINFCLVFVGSVANVINCVIFSKHGFKDTVNISLFALAVSDLCSLLPLVWHGLLVDPRFLGTNVDFIGAEVQFLSAGWPHTIFTKVTSWVTAFIMFERCLCIAIPLKVKTVLTTSRVKLCLVSIYVIVLAGVVPTYATHSIGWKFYPEYNRSLVGLKLTENSWEVTKISNVINNPLSSFSSFGLVLFCTVIITIQLNRKTKWREGTSTTGSGDKGSNSSKDRRAVKMVTVVSVIFLVSVTPSIIVVIVSVKEFEFTLTGKYRNLFYVAYSITFVLEALNSSVNILVYYNMNSRYRKTFKNMFYFNGTKTV